MNNEQLQRTLRLLRRTGDRGIVLDPGSDEVFVLMDADTYEEMLGGTEPMPSAGNDHLDDYVLDDLGHIDESVENITPAVPEAAKTPAAVAESKEAGLSKLNFSENWDAKKSAVVSEESLADVPHEEEAEPAEEEKFYLEPIE